MKKINPLPPLNLLIVCKDNSQEAALRIYEPSPLNGAEPGKQIFYTSTRIGGLKKHNDGYVFENADEFVGKKFELKLLGTFEIIKGVVGNEPGKTIDEILSRE